MVEMAFDTSAVYSSIAEAGASLGDIYMTKGKVYVFLKGVSGVAQYQAVTFNGSNYQTALLAANGVGSVAVAQAPVVTNKYGWFQVWGATPVLSGTVVANKALYIAASNLVDDAAVSGDKINNMFSTAASGSVTDDAGNSVTATSVWMTYPMVDDASSAGA